MRKIAVAGHFNPLHVGHLQLIKAARDIDPNAELMVIVANDHQAALKRPKVFIPLAERMMIMSEIKGVNQVYASIDLDSSIKETLKLLRPDILASGSDDGHPDAIAEEQVCRELGIKTVWRVGGEKIRNSSEYLNNYVQEK